MATTSDAATLLLQSGLIIGAVLLAHAYATRHLPDAIPSFLYTRIAWTIRVRPLLLACAGLAVLSGLVLRLT